MYWSKGWDEGEVTGILMTFPPKSKKSDPETDMVQIRIDFDDIKDSALFYLLLEWLRTSLSVLADEEYDLFATTSPSKNHPTGNTLE